MREAVYVRYIAVFVFRKSLGQGNLPQGDRFRAVRFGRLFCYPVEKYILSTSHKNNKTKKEEEQKP